MVLSQSERISLLLQSSRKYVSRNKVRDSSELTLINQAKASTTSVPSIVQATADPHTSQLIPSYDGSSDCAATVYYTGVGTKDQTAILYKKQGCAVCADDDPAINPYIVIPTPCYNKLDFPFIQKNLSTPVVCDTPGFNVYFPPALPCPT
jgi:hypothetical protein